MVSSRFEDPPSRLDSCSWLSTSGTPRRPSGLFDGDTLAEHRRLATDATARATSSARCSATCSTSASVDGICLSSTVPALIREYELFAERWAKAPILVVEPGVRTGIPMRHDAPHQVGPDRIVNSVAAKERYGAPCIVVDFGTSTNFDVVSAAGRVRRRRARTGDRDLDGGALRPSGALDEGRPRRAAGRDRQDDRAGPAVRSRLRLRRPGRPDRRGDQARARRRGAGRRDRGACGPRSCRTAGRSSSSIPG